MADRSEVKVADEAFAYNSSITFLPIHLAESLISMNAELAKIDELLVDDGVESIYHINQEDNIDYSMEMLGELLAYSSDLAFYALELIDKPLYKNFNLNATESISRIKVEDYSTENTLGITYTTHASYGDTQNAKKTLSIEDFLGVTAPENGGNLSNIPKEFSDFSNQYVTMYENLKANLVDEDGNQITLEEYLDQLVSMGEFSHTKDQPFREFLSAVLDITIILPLIEACTGTDYITDEDLSDFERGMKGVGAVVGVFSLGTSYVAMKGAGLATQEILMNLGKAVTIDAASTATSYWTGKECSKMGLPLPLTLMLSMGAGMGTSYGLNSIFIKNAIVFEDSVTYNVDDKAFNKKLNKILRDNNLTLDDFDRLRLSDPSELTHYEKFVMKQIRESIPVPDSNTLMQKAIPLNDVSKYMDGQYTQVGGYVSRAQDVTSLNSYDAIYESLRLDYPNTAYNVDTDEALAVIRFKTDSVGDLEIPYGHEMGGNVNADQPFTGNGFTKSTNGMVVPEYKLSNYVDMKDGAELILIGKNGEEQVVGVFSCTANKFVPVQ